MILLLRVLRVEFDEGVHTYKNKMHIKNCYKLPTTCCDLLLFESFVRFKLCFLSFMAFWNVFMYFATIRRRL